ncbi:uncharacterized protein Tco025E_04512 [Trypanosoma conorhini]|uniref:Uncharacterized protein n=1 Tax=Trypanosoma conorhini TaxID=83891 RepID=A0A3R7L8M4_9TRYP|nr:uncharacterized protein Tco025E_04512 [Trypanosoma conorhini]RNF18395.1 hypothetical protein Tco025E_04512 [Trypanosoma conorhini]
MNHLHGRNQLLDLPAPPPPPPESGAIGPLAEAVELVESPIARRGHSPLRPPEVVCGKCYAGALEEMERTLCHYFSLDATPLMEDASGTLPSALEVLHPPFPELSQGDEERRDASDSPHFINVGELHVLHPLCPDCTLPLSSCSPASTHFTVLYDPRPKFYNTLRNYAARHAMEVAYSALRCKSIIVCGWDGASVVEAVKVACLFVPGLLQGREYTLRLCILPANSSQLLSAEGILHRFAVAGCHVNAALRHGAPQFAQTCTWHAGRQGKARGCRAINPYGD